MRELLAFELGAEFFGIGIGHLSEILRLPARVTRVPRAPEAVLGIIMVRGEIVTLVDLRRRLARAPAPAPAPAGRDQRVLVVRRGGEPYGLVVDRVTQVLRVPEAAIEPPPATLRGAGAEFIGAVAFLGTGRMVVLLDVERTLGLPQAAATGEAGRREEGSR